MFASPPAHLTSSSTIAPLPCPKNARCLGCAPSLHKQSTDTQKQKREREMFYLTTHSTHFIYGYMASYIWLRTILIVRKETRCSHIGYSYRLAARVLLYAPSHRQDNTYHSLCYTSRGALAGMRNIERKGKERNVVFNDALNTVIWHRTYGKEPFR